MARQPQLGFWDLRAERCQGPLRGHLQWGEQWGAGTGLPPSTPNSHPHRFGLHGAARGPGPVPAPPALGSGPEPLFSNELIPASRYYCYYYYFLMLFLGRKIISWATWCGWPLQRSSFLLQLGGG